MNMEKISVSIRIPALDITQDFIVPSTMKMMDVRQLVVDILFSEYGVKSLVSNVIFIDKSDAKALSMDASLAQMGIGDGAKLMLL